MKLYIKGFSRIKKYNWTYYIAALVLIIGSIILILWRSQFYFFSEKELLPKTAIVTWETRRAALRNTLLKYETDFEKVTKLREFAAYHADWSSACYSGHWFRSAQDIYNYYEVDEGGGCCGMAALYLAKIYREFGFESCTYNMGYPEDSSTHVSTVVKIKHKVRWIRIVQDATFNFTVTDTTGTPVDIEHLILDLLEKNLTDIKILQPQQINSSETLITDLAVPLAHWTLTKNDLKIVKSHGVRFPYKIISPRRFDRFITKMSPRYFSSLANDGMPENLLYLFLKPIGECKPEKELPIHKG